MDPFLGQIQTFGFGFAPANWATCNGQLLAISQNQALFALLGTTFGGNGTTTYQLPNLAGAVTVGQGQALTGSTYVWGEQGGAEHVTLTTNLLPPHTHVATFTPSGGGGITATLNAIAGAGATSSPTAGAYLANTGPGAQAAKIYTAANPSGTQVALGGLSVTGGGGGGTVSNASTGSGQPTPIMQPYVTVYTCIALQGIFPSRG